MQFLYSPSKVPASTKHFNPLACPFSSKITTLSFYLVLIVKTSENKEITRKITTGKEIKYLTDFLF